MNKFLVLLICLPLSAFSQGINFQNDLTWDQARIEARKQSKFIFLDIYATWCKPCKQMDKDVYDNDTVGKYMNENFISIKVQADKTNKDNAEIMKWYQDAEYIQNHYQIEGFPSFLFFDPSGRLMFKQVGFHDISGFLKMARDAQDSSRNEIYKALEKYKAGEKDYSKMLQLIDAARELLSDLNLADSIAKDYKYNYLDKIEAKDALKIENMFFIGSNMQLLNSSDRFFQLIFTSQMLKTDTVFNYIANNIILYVINKEEIVDKLYQQNRLVNLNPNWLAIENSISTKYGPKYVKRVLPKAKLDFYYKTKDWNGYAQMVKLLLKTYPPKIEGNNFDNVIGTPIRKDEWALNQVAWTLFLFCNEKKLLKEALKWSELSIKLSSPSGALYQYLDTKANIMYKLAKLFKVGSVKRAIQVEKMALTLVTNFSIASSIEEYSSIISKMENGEKTWPPMRE